MTTATVVFKPTFFPFPRPLNSCAECGTRILNLNGQTLEEQDMGYRRVHFDLSDDTSAFVSFCPGCAEKPWTEERIVALETQCKRGWNRMQNPGTKPGWNGDHLKFKPAAQPVQTWSEVQ